MEKPRSHQKPGLERNKDGLFDEEQLAAPSIGGGFGTVCFLQHSFELPGEFLGC